MSEASPAILHEARREAGFYARQELAAIEQVLRRRRWLRDPELWLRERTGEAMWSGQRDIFSAVRDNRKTLVASCHEIGKSWLGGRLTGWWLDSHPIGEAFVVTTAPTGRQVRSILWKEIGRTQSAGLPGRTNQTEWFMNVPRATGLKEELVAFGFKPANYDPAAFQGIHARFVLALVDEACGVRGPLWDAIESLCANDESKIALFGNPDDPVSEFFDYSKPGSGYATLNISAFDTPAFTGEAVPADLLRRLIGRTYVEEKRKKWARSWTWNDAGTRVVPPTGSNEFDTHPFWQSKVLGRFPKQSAEGTLIQLSWIRDAQERQLERGTPIELGGDIGAGGDASASALRSGDVVRIVSEDTNPDTMQTCGKLIAEARSANATRVKVDRNGIGAGVVDRANEQGEAFIGINVGEKPVCICTELKRKNTRLVLRPGRKHFDDCNCSQFLNLRAQLWWELRQRFESGRIDLDPEDSDTADELLSIRFKINSAGLIQIESKDDAKRRGVASPNRAEAVMLVFAEAPPEGSVEGGVLRGKATW